MKIEEVRVGTKFALLGDNLHFEKSAHRELLALLTRDDRYNDMKGGEFDKAREKIIKEYGLRFDLGLLTPMGDGIEIGGNSDQFGYPEIGSSEMVEIRNNTLGIFVARYPNIVFKASYN